MANLNELVGTGTAFKRCHRVLIENPVNGSPTIMFGMQDVAKVGDRTIASDCGCYIATFNPEGKIMLRDMTTGEYDGSYIMQIDVYKALYSMFITLAVNSGVMPQDQPIVDILPALKSGDS